MRNYIHHILATFIFVAGVASIQAQTWGELDNPVISWDPSVAYTPVQTDADKVWHVVAGTEITVTLNATKPQDTNEKKYTNTIIYRKGDTVLTTNKDTFTPTNGEERSYTASFEYEVYVLNPETQQYEGTSNYQFDQSPAKSVKFKTYSTPNVDDLTVSSPTNYTYKTASPVSFNAIYNYNPESNGLTYKIEWKKNTTLVKSGTEKTYDLSTDEIGEPTIEATLTIYAPNRNTPWVTKSANKTIKIFNKPTVNGIEAERYYALVGDASFNVTVKVTKDSGITTEVAWTGGVIGTAETGSFSPDAVGTSNVSATVTFKDPEGNKLLISPSPVTKTIQVYNVPTFTGINPEKKYTVVSGTSFNVTANVTKDSGITTEVTWENGVDGSSETGLFNPVNKTAQTYNVSAVVTFKDPGGNTLITLPKENDNPISTDIIVYEKPTIDDIKPDRDYALKGDDPINIEVTVTKDAEITAEVDWTGDVTGDDMIGSFYPNTVGIFNVSAKVTFKDPDGNILLGPIPSAQKKIQVYNMPTFTSITSDKKYTMVGNLVFNVKANVTKDSGITTEVMWDGGATGTSETGSFNPNTNPAGSYDVSATVTFKGPDKKTLITLPRENEDPITTRIIVYNKPVINGIIFPDNEDFVYAGGQIQMIIDTDDIDDGITPKVTWFSGYTIEKDPNDELKATFKAPDNLFDDTEATIWAQVSFNGPDNVSLVRENSPQKKVMIYTMSLNPNKDVTYVGDPDFKVDINGFVPIRGSYEYKAETSWSEGVIKDPNNELSATLGSISIPDGNDYQEMEIKANVEVSARQIGSDGSWFRMPNFDRKLKPQKVLVYKTPNVANVDLSSDSYNSCVGKERILTAIIDYEPKTLPIQYEWCEGNDKMTNFVEVSNKQLENGKTEIKIKYTPKSEAAEGNQINIKIWVNDPKGEEKWSEEKSAAEPLKITVYENPEVAIQEETIKEKIKEPDNDPGKIIGYEGQKVGEEEQDISFEYSVTEAPSNNYRWNYIWELYKDGDNNAPFSTNSTGSFEALPQGEYTVVLKAHALNPDANSEEDWGTITCTLDHPITIYPAPLYQSLGNHLKESDDTNNSDKYSILTGDTFDANKLFSYKDEDKVTGYPNDSNNPDSPYGWHGTLSVKKDGTTIKDNDKVLTFSPTEKGEYTLTLNVTNNAPTGIWENKNNTYTLYVYDKPQWDTSNFDKLFDNPIDNKYDRHIKSNELIPFEVTGKDGDQNSEWNVTMTSPQINNGEPESFNSSEFPKFTYTFQEQNTSDKEEKTYDFHIQGSNSINYLSKDSKPEPLDIHGTIHVWKDITANVEGLDADDEGNYVLETREGDSAEQVIELALVGGDPEKWSIAPPTKDGPDGVSSKDGYKYTYTIQDLDLKADEDGPKTYTYAITANYDDGATHTGDKQFTFKVKVWPEPAITQTLALSNDKNNDNKNVSYIEQSGKYNVICYNSDVLEMTVTRAGGNTERGLWKYQTPDMTEKKELPQPDSDNKIKLAITKPGTTYFYNYLTSENGGTKEKEVKSIVTQIDRRLDPIIVTKLPEVDNTTADIWNAAINQNKAVDLYGGILPNGSQHVAHFDFSPQSGTGYEANTGDGGWKYSWRIDDVEQDNVRGVWDYTAKTSSNDSYETKKITVIIKNSIPAGNGQEGENFGFNNEDNPLTYYVRVWHEAILPNDYSLTDAFNTGNNIKETHAIREGNKLIANVAPIEYGYSNKFHYDWTGQGAQDLTDWENEKMTNTDNGDGPGSSLTTYGLHVYNYGPRNNNIWAEKTYDPCKVYIYNHPETPASLVMKGKGNSGTMIITYTDIMSDAELESRDDYVITFCYTDKDGNLQKIYKPQGGKGEVRWATGFPTDASQMSNVYAYAEWHYVNQETGQNVLITSGKRALNDTESDKDWDESIYNFSNEMMQAIRAITRAGSGDYTDIRPVDSDESFEGELSVYNMNGMLVGTSTKDLTPGIYIIRYKQDGIIKSKKLSVK